MDGLAEIRAQRAEVEALVAFTCAAEGEAKILAWWRLQRRRRERCAALGPAADRLPALPAPPPGALGRLQVLRLRLGWTSLVAVRPSRSVARRMEA